MSSVHAVILRDYPRRVRFPASLVLIFFLLMPAVKGYVERADWAGEYGYLAGALILILWTGLVSGHLKQTLARPEGRLLPGYAPAQIRVALGLLLPAVAMCLAGAKLAGFSWLAAMALTTFLAALYWSWPYLFDRGNLLLLFGPTCVWWLSALAKEPRLHDWPAWMGTGLREDFWWVLLLAVSLGICLFVLRRMLRLTESCFEYSRDPSIGWRRGTSPDSDAPFASFFRSVLPWFGRYRIVPRSSLHDAGAWARICHWRRGMGPSAPVITGLSMAALVALMGLFFRLYDERSPTAESLILLIYLMILPFSRYSWTHRRKDRFEIELLYPARRERMVRELSLATAIDILETWFFLGLGTLVIRSLGLLDTIPWWHYPYYFAISLGTTFLGLGLVPWILRLQGDKWPSLLLTILVTLVGLFVGLTLKDLVGFDSPGVWIGAAVVLAGIGAVGMVHGYRLWCRLELGRSDL